MAGHVDVACEDGRMQNAKRQEHDEKGEHAKGVVCTWTNERPPRPFSAAAAANERPSLSQSISFGVAASESHHQPDRSSEDDTKQSIR